MCQSDEYLITRGCGQCIDGEPCMDECFGGDPLPIVNKVTKTLVVNEATGGMKESASRRFGLLPYEQLGQVAEVYAFGARKYEDWNWTKGYDWSLSYDALQRHLAEFWVGNDDDEETGLHHVAHAAWHCLTLLYFSKYHEDLDDRHKPPQVRPL